MMIFAINVPLAEMNVTRFFTSTSSICTKNLNKLAFLCFFTWLTPAISKTI